MAMHTACNSVQLEERETNLFFFSFLLLLKLELVLVKISFVPVEASLEIIRIMILFYKKKGTVD